jgi:hypothetical protein
VTEALSPYAEPLVRIATGLLLATLPACPTGTLGVQPSSQPTGQQASPQASVNPTGETTITPSGAVAASCPAAGDVKLLYPAKQGGTSFNFKEIDPNNNEDYYDNHEGIDGESSKFTKMTENGVEFWRSTGALGRYDDGRPNAMKHRLGAYPSGCRTMQKYGWQSGAAEHGYTCKPEDPRDQEVTAYFRLLPELSGTFQQGFISVRGGHSGLRPDANSRTNFGIHNSGVCKQFTGTDYRCQNIDSKFPFSMRSNTNNWIGAKVVTYNLPDGKSTKNEVYVDTDGFDASGKPKGNWKLWYEWSDVPGGSPGGDWPVATWGGQRVGIRIDGYKEVDFAHFSVCSITPRQIF